jgi:esterase/lipase/1-acyl-sn-glycerol-3-phosphate acyltransferase
MATRGIEPEENYRDAPGSPSGVQPVIRPRVVEGPGPWQQPGGYTRRATSIALRILESMIQSKIRVEGTQNLGRGPILFVANHFTRFETFVLPYIIDKYAKRNVHSLAHHALFRGKFGDYLRAIGAMSTRDPDIKHIIVEELIRGVNDWIIYPEGSMIKDKHTWSKGKWDLNSPDRVGPPHTGAAVLALQAEIYRQLYLDACGRGDAVQRTAYERRFHIEGPGSMPSEQLAVVPINITYYPIRATRNLIYKLARFMLKELPSRLEDELMIEGALLLDKTDISVYFGKPIAFDRYRDLLKPALAAMGEVDEEEKLRRIIDAFKVRLTNRFMAEIYSRLTINFDHLFCSGLRYLARDKIPREDFHLALFLAARELQASGSRRRHHSLAGRMQAIIADEPFAPLDSISRLAIDEGVLRVRDERYVVDHQALDRAHGFHDIRLKNTVAVIANELEPLREVVKNVRTLVNLPRAQLRARAAKLLRDEDQAAYEREYSRCQATPHRKDPIIGRPFLLEGRRGRVGVVLSHGYLASPGEVRGLAEHLNKLGHTVYVVRLKGHGTSPERLHTVSWTDWLESFDRGYAIVRSLCDRVVVGGFSTGGLLALIAAARKGRGVPGAFAVNPPLKLMEKTAAFAPMVDGWNKLLDLFHIKRGHLDFVENHPEWPLTNYDRNYIHGIHELERLMAAARAELPHVSAPTLVIQGDRDPVVDPAGARVAIELVGAERKELAPMSFARHCIVQGEGSELVCGRIGEFVGACEDGLGRLRPPRAGGAKRSERMRKIS